MELPRLKFVEFQDKTKAGFDSYIKHCLWEHESGVCQNEFLVYMRSKYDCDTEWRYHLEFCEYCMDTDSLEWWNDWDEGQQHIEYLAVCCVQDW